MGFERYCEWLGAENGFVGGNNEGVEGIRALLLGGDYERGEFGGGCALFFFGGWTMRYGWGVEDKGFWYAVMFGTDIGFVDRLWYGDLDVRWRE